MVIVDWLFTRRSQDRTFLHVHLASDVVRGFRRVKAAASYVSKCQVIY